MTTPASAFKSVVINALSNAPNQSLPIGDLYKISLETMEFDHHDLSKVKVEGKQTEQLVWKRNLRNCLQTLKGNNTLSNDLKGNWGLAIKNNELLNPEESWVSIKYFATTALNDNLSWYSTEIKNEYLLDSLESNRINIIRSSTGSIERLYKRDVIKSINIFNSLNGKVPRGGFKMSVAKEVTIVQFHPNLSWDANNEFIILTSATEEEHEIAKESCEAPNDDLASLQSYARRIRKGAGKLRAKLLSAYNYKCCISNTGPENVLQAAHIEPHSKSGINHSTNAILLRSDIHDLFDDGLLKIEPKTLIIHVHPKLIGTAYEKYNGVVLAKRSDGLSPDMIKLQERWDFTVWKDI